MKLLITGGAGFIGSNLARHALRAGHTVTVLDDLSTGSLANLAGLDVTFVRGSILDRGKLNESLDGAHAVVHLAARPSVPRSIADPIASHAANATGTLMLLEGARTAAHSPHVTVASSSSVYGANPALPKQGTAWLAPMSPYAVSKVATEQYAIAYQQSFGLKTIAFRFFNVYGPRQAAGHAYAAVIPALLDAAINSRPFSLYGTGEQSRDFTFVETVAQVLLNSAERQVVSERPVNLAFGTNTSLNDLIDLTAALLGQRPAIEQHDARRGDVLHSQADNSLLRSLFPDVSPVALEEGLRRTLHWFRSEADKGAAEDGLR